MPKRKRKKNNNNRLKASSLRVQHAQFSVDFLKNLLDVELTKTYCDAFSLPGLIFLLKRNEKIMAQSQVRDEI